jgi:hypothetical protein
MAQHPRLVASTCSAHSRIVKAAGGEQKISAFTCSSASFGRSAARTNFRMAFPASPALQIRFNKLWCARRSDVDLIARHSITASLYCAAERSIAACDRAPRLAVSGF